MISWRRSGSWTSSSATTCSSSHTLKQITVSSADSKAAAFENWVRATSSACATAAFQKVRTRDLKQNVEGWMGDWYPAEVEGSDPKKIEEVGRGTATFLKMGAFTFEAVRFALKPEQTVYAKAKYRSSRTPGCAPCDSRAESSTANVSIYRPR